MGSKVFTVVEDEFGRRQIWQSDGAVAVDPLAEPIFTAPDIWTNKEVEAKAQDLRNQEFARNLGRGHEASNIAVMGD